MNLRDLSYLVALDDHRHFGRAAEACFVSQPTLSTQLKKLEDELGVELIERSPRHVMLTETGRQVVEAARVVLDETARIRAIAAQARDPRSGSIRLGLFPTLGPYLLPHVVPALRRQLPDLEVLLVEDKTDPLLDQLNNGRVDAAVLALPVPADHLVRDVLFTEDFLLAVPRGHPLADGGDPVDVSVLQGAPVLLLEEGHCLRQQALEVCHLAQSTERRDFRATSLETLRQMVGAGVGVTLLPELAVHPPVPPSEDLQLLRFRDPVPSRTVAMFWRPTSVYRDLLPEVAGVLRDLPAGLVHAPPARGAA
ncbi:MAG: LysR substrate-binding domain-containing protein [Ilumatobacteraceae bacterium]